MELICWQDHLEIFQKVKIFQSVLAYMIYKDDFY